MGSCHNLERGLLDLSHLLDSQPDRASFLTLTRLVRQRAPLPLELRVFQGASGFPCGRSRSVPTSTCMLAVFKILVQQVFEVLSFKRKIRAAPRAGLPQVRGVPHLSLTGLALHTRLSQRINQFGSNSKPSRVDIGTQGMAAPPQSQAGISAMRPGPGLAPPGFPSSKGPPSVYPQPGGHPRFGGPNAPPQFPGPGGLPTTPTGPYAPNPPTFGAAPSFGGPAGQGKH